MHIFKKVGLLNPDCTEFIINRDGAEFDLVQIICDYYDTNWQEPTMQTLPSETTRVYISYDNKINPELAEVKGEIITGTYYVSGPNEQRTGFYYIDPWTLKEKRFPNTVVYFAPTP